MTLSLLKCGNSSFSHYDCLSLSFKYCIHMDMQSSVRYDNIFTNTCPVSRRMHASVKVKVLNRKQPVKLDQKQYMLGTWNFNDFWWKINIIIHNSLYIHTYSSIICHDMKIDSLPLFSFFFFLRFKHNKPASNFHSLFGHGQEQLLARGASSRLQ